jgi:hypothetical protein
MIEAKARIPGSSLALVVPERVNRVLGMHGPDCVDPSLVEQALESCPRRQLKESVSAPRAGIVDIGVSRHDIEITYQGDRHLGGEQIRGVNDQALEPRQFIGEFWPGSRIAIWQIQAPDQHALDRRLNVSCLTVGGITRQGRPGQHGSASFARIATPFQLRSPRLTAP